MEKTKSLDAKVQIHRLATKYRNISDIPYKTKEEQKVEAEIIANINQIVEHTSFKNEVDKKDFEDYLQEKLGVNNFEVPEPENITQGEEEELREVLDEGEAIPQIQQIRQKQTSVKEDIKKLQDRKKELNLLKQKEKLNVEIDNMERQVTEAQKEESFLTDKKDKEGLIKLRHDKYNKTMDNLNIDKIELEQMLEISTDEEEIEIIKEALKINKKKRNKLRSVKIQTYFQNAMVKIPKKIASISNAISDLSKGLGSMGGNLNSYGKGDGMADLQVGRSSRGNDFGFNEKDMFGGSQQKEKKEPKKRKRRRKKSKRKR